MKDNFLLFIAPPGWGKTSMLIDLYYKSDSVFIFVSPLRALANELYERMIDIKGVQLVSKKTDLIINSEKKFIIITPELLRDDFISSMNFIEKDIICVFDEFHLFYYWGESFRPRLKEVLYGVCSTKVSVMGLSATIDNEILKKIKNEFFLEYDSIKIINLGNQMLKNLPFKKYYYPVSLKRTFYKSFWSSLFDNQADVILFFCRYREEVDRFVNYAKSKKLNVIGCKGGEIEQFRTDLKNNPRPKCIFATSALGHGVNLPSLSKVYINYPVKNIDFWYQMVGRGGRRGEKFDIYTFDRYNLSKYEYMVNVFRNLINLIKEIIFAN